MTLSLTALPKTDCVRLALIRRRAKARVDTRGSVDFRQRRGPLSINNLRQPEIAIEEAQWAYLDSNQGPQLYQSCALAN